ITCTALWTSGSKVTVWTTTSGWRSPSASTTGSERGRTARGAWLTSGKLARPADQGKGAPRGAGATPAMSRGGGPGAASRGRSAVSSVSLQLVAVTGVAPIRTVDGQGKLAPRIVTVAPRAVPPRGGVTQVITRRSEASGSSSTWAAPLATSIWVTPKA